jgi:hypothetical protein
MPLIQLAHPDVFRAHRRMLRAYSFATIDVGSFCDYGSYQRCGFCAALFATGSFSPVRIRVVPLALFEG